MCRKRDERIKDRILSVWGDQHHLGNNNQMGPDDRYVMGTV